MSQSIQTVAQLLALFADGQAAGSITPQYVRDLVVSIGSIAGNTNSVPVNALGNGGTALTINPASGLVVSFNVNSSSACILTLGNYGTSSVNRVSLELYVTQNTSGNGTITWPSQVTWAGSTPQPSTVANSTTRFELVSLDNGNTWSIL